MSNDQMVIKRVFGPKSAVRKVRFGSVVIEARQIDPVVLLKNVAAGQAALKRVRKVLIKPGVKLTLGRKIPRFHVDQDDPGQLVRVLNGKREVGRLIAGKFEPSR